MASRALLKSCASVRRCATVSGILDFDLTLRLPAILYLTAQNNFKLDASYRNYEIAQWFDTQFPPCKNRGRGFFLQGGLGSPRYAVTCRSGGIGRRAWFRSMYPQGCGGSSPFFGTIAVAFSAASVYCWRMESEYVMRW
jgi:hypothetical protein